MAVERDGLKRVFVSSLSSPFVHVWIAKVVDKFNFVTGFHKLSGKVGNADRPWLQIVVDIVRMDHQDSHGRLLHIDRVYRKWPILVRVKR